MEVIAKRVPGGVRMGDMVMMGANKSRLSGVYAITNSVNGKQYIGSASNMQVRLASHRHALKAQRHHSQKLQRAWNKYGEPAFVFKPLMMCAPEMILFYEQTFLDSLNVAETGYNILRTAGSRKGMKHSEETKAKIRDGNLGKVMSPESREKMRQRMLGNVPSEETRRKIGIGAKSWKRDPEQMQKFMNAGHSPESRAKTSAALMGHSVSEETRAKMSAAGMGRVIPPEVRKKMSDGMKASIARRKALKGGA